MKHLNKILFILCALGGQALAQEPALVIKDLDFDAIQSPNFSSQSHKHVSGNLKHWFQLSLEYDVAGRGIWLDSVELEWHVMLDSSQGNILLGKKITYADVPEGEHYAVVYLRPHFIERYGKREKVDKRDLKVLVIVRVDGKEVQRRHYPSAIPKSEWWKVGTTGTIIKRDELFARAETPFAALDWDFYQDIKSHAPVSPKIDDKNIVE